MAIYSGFTQKMVIFHSKRLPEGTTSVHVFVTLVQIFGFVIHVFPRAASENRIAADSPENVRFFVKS